MKFKLIYVDSQTGTEGNRNFETLSQALKFIELWCEDYWKSYNLYFEK